MLSTSRRLAFRRLVLQTQNLSPGAQSVVAGINLCVDLHKSSPVHGLDAVNSRTQRSERQSLQLIKEDKMPKAAFYAVAFGRKPGIYGTWNECKAQVDGHPGAVYKKFNHKSDADAFIDSRRKARLGPGAGPSTSSPPKLPSSTSGIDLGNIVKETQKEKSSSSSSRGRRGESPLAAHATADQLPSDPAALAKDGWMFTNTDPPRLIAYTDGSGLSNGTRRAMAGLGVYWGEGKAAKYNLSERVPGMVQTNNRGELLAIIRAIETCPFPELPLEIRTDSQYSIHAMTLYLPNWIKNGWRTRTGPVKNADMIKHLLVLLRRRAKPVRFKHVRGHSGHHENEKADSLARGGAIKPTCERTDWLDPDDEDPVAADKREPTDVGVDIHPDWLMNPEELASLEQSLAEDEDAAEEEDWRRWKAARREIEGSGGE